MKKILGTLGAVLLGTQLSFSVPFLQLDIDPGTYVGGGEESTIATSDAFTLLALVDQSSSSFINGATYYISIAVTPKVSGSPGPNLGSISFAGQTINVTADMDYGTPPLVEMLPHNADLQSHGIFETYYYEWDFDLSGAADVASYNVEDGSSSPGTLKQVSFDVDVSGLADGYEIHFDLYTLQTDNSGKRVVLNAPFSHDAGTGGNGVPDGGSTLALLGLAALGLQGVRRHLNKA